MNEIKRHSFDVAKKRIKEFSEKNEEELSIDKVRTSGGFLGICNHKVTGEELNKRLGSIQGHLVELNATNNKIVKEFREIYNALDILDKDYITSIVANVKAIEKTSNDVREQQKYLKQHNDKLDMHQVEIDKNIENMNKIVTALRNFQKRMDEFKHLTDVDMIWSDCLTMRNEMNVISDSIVDLEKKTKSDIKIVNSKFKILLEQVNKVIDDINDLETGVQIINSNIEDTKKCIVQIESFIDVLNGYEHLKNIDQVWSDLENVKTEITDFYQLVEECKNKVEIHQTAIDSFKEENKKQDERLDELLKDLIEVKGYSQTNRGLIEELQSFRSDIDAIEHVSEIDSMWDQGNSLKKNIDEVNSHILSHKEKIMKIENTIDEKSRETLEKITVLETKLKYTYYIAGGALGFAVIELILALNGVI